MDSMQMETYSSAEAEQTTPPGSPDSADQRGTELGQTKNSGGRAQGAGGKTVKKGCKKSGDKLKGRPSKLTTSAVNKEIRILSELFVGEQDQRRKKLIDDLIAETAFLKVACRQAKEEMKADGLTVETVNASQKFTKAHPAAQIYQQYNKQYAAHLGQLIELLPEEKKEERSRLAAFRQRATT